MTAESEECLEFVHRSMTEKMEIPEKVAPVSGYQAWKDNEKQFNDRLVQGIKKSEAGRSLMSTPGQAFWASPLGWAHAEYLLFDTEVETIDTGLLVPELQVKGVRRPN